jgi:hypothetical protein
MVRRITVIILRMKQANELEINTVGSGVRVTLAYMHAHFFIFT